MDKRRRRFLTASMLAPLALSGACSGQPSLTRVGGISWIGYAPLFLARELGFYDGDTLRLLEMPSNTANLMSLATANLEAATLTLDECLLAREGGIDARAILVFDYSAGADVILARKCPSLNWLMPPFCVPTQRLPSAPCVRARTRLSDSPSLVVQSR